MKRGENSGLTPPCGTQTEDEGPGDKAAQEMDRWVHVQTDACLRGHTPGRTHAQISMQTALTNYCEEQSK